MPYVSKAQQGYFHAHKAELEKQGVDVGEWDAASKGSHDLPEHTKKPKASGLSGVKHT
jgi:hypothetical protein